MTDIVGRALCGKRSTACAEKEAGNRINLIFLFPPRSHLVDRLESSSALQAGDKSSFKVGIFKV